MNLSKTFKLLIASALFISPILLKDLNDQDYYEHSYEIVISFEEIFGDQAHSFFENMFNFIDELSLSNEIKAFLKNLILTIIFASVGFLISLATGYVLQEIMGRLITRIIKKALKSIEDTNEPGYFWHETEEGYFANLRHLICKTALDKTGDRVHVSKFTEDETISEYLNITQHTYVNLLTKVEDFFMSKGFKTKHSTILALCVIAFAETEPLKQSETAVFRFCVTADENPSIYFSPPSGQNFCYV